MDDDLKDLDVAKMSARCSAVLWKNVTGSIDEFFVVFIGDLLSSFDEEIYQLFLVFGLELILDFWDSLEDGLVQLNNIFAIFVWNEVVFVLHKMKKIVRGHVLEASKFALFKHLGSVLLLYSLVVLLDVESVSFVLFEQLHLFFY